MTNRIKLKECPFCKKDAVTIGVHDDEGNYHGELGCEYESNPWSGLCYGLHHWDGWNECILCSDEGVMGGVLFDTPEDAKNEWNKIISSTEKREKLEALKKEYDINNTVKLLRMHTENTLFPYAAEIIEKLEELI